MGSSLLTLIDLGMVAGLSVGAKEHVRRPHSRVLQACPVIVVGDDALPLRYLSHISYCHMCLHVYPHAANVLFLSVLDHRSGMWCHVSTVLQFIS
jgi:hypothetical protein